MFKFANFLNWGCTPSKNIEKVEKKSNHVKYRENDPLKTEHSKLNIDESINLKEIEGEDDKFAEQGLELKNVENNLNLNLKFDLNPSKEIEKDNNIDFMR